MELGVFKSLWDGQAHYLPFLNLQGSEKDSKECNLNISINRLNKIFETNPEQSIIDGIKSLLEVDGWRTHLVASIAVLKLQPSKRLELVDLFWKRLFQGTMVSPQILVVLLIIDKSFKVKGQEVLNGLADSKFVSFYDSLGHPPDPDLRVKGAIEYLVKSIIIPNDIREGGRLAQNWKDRLFELIEKGEIKIE